MFFRQSLTVLLSGFVAICPMLHVGQACGSAACASTVCETDRHPHHGHSHEGPGHQDSDPQEPDHEENSTPAQNCFCDGATLVTVVRTGVEMDGCWMEGRFLTTLQVEPLSPAVVVSTLAGRFSRGCHFPPGMSGREICSLKSLRLI